MSAQQQGQVIDLAAYRKPPTEPMLKLTDLVVLYGKSERWFRYRLAEGMPAHKWGGHYRFRASEIEAWMEDRYAS